MRILGLCVLAFIISACGSGLNDSSNSETSSVVSETNRWPTPKSIPVCFMNRKDVSNNIIQDVKSHVRSNFMKDAGIGFTGWGDCTDSDKKNNVIRVRFNKVHDWENKSSTTAGGGQSMVGTSPYSCPNGCEGGTMRLDIGRTGDYPSAGLRDFTIRLTRATAVHEFGHAIGLLHEHERTDSVNCPVDGIKAEEQAGQIKYIGGFDATSIMSYCHPGDLTTLSAGDIAGIHYLYPGLKNLANSTGIRSASSNRCLDVQEFSSDPTALIQQWDCNYQRNQLWWVYSVGNDLYQIKSVASDLCLDIEDHFTGNGGRLQQWKCRESSNQRVRILNRANGAKSLQFVHSGKCLDMRDGNTANGNTFQQWDCAADNKNQQFYF